MTGLNWGRGSGIETKYISTKAARCVMQLQQESFYLSGKEYFLSFTWALLFTFIISYKNDVNIVYGILKSENSQDYAQKPQRNSSFMNSAFWSTSVKSFHTEVLYTFDINSKRNVPLHTTELIAIFNKLLCQLGKIPNERQPISCFVRDKASVLSQCLPSLLSKS